MFNLWCNNETEILSYWWHFHHWLHWRLSCWQLPLQPVLKMSSKWHFYFSESYFLSIPSGHWWSDSYYECLLWLYPAPILPTRPHNLAWRLHAQDSVECSNCLIPYIIRSCHYSLHEIYSKCLVGNELFNFKYLHEKPLFVSDLCVPLS